MILGTRITNLTIKNNYTNHLNINQKRLNDANLRVSDGRRFTSMSEDVALGLRSMKVRRDLSKNLTWQDNTAECKSILKATEDTLRGLLPSLDKANFEKYVQALNGTNSVDEYYAINAEIKQIQKDVLKTLNAEFSGRYLYGGSQINEAPFDIFSDPADPNHPDTGKLMYRGVLVASLDPATNPKLDPSDSNFDPTDPEYLKFLAITNDPVYIDLGLGMTLDASGNPIPSTVFDRSVNGLDIVGTGKENIYDVLGEVIASLDAAIANQDPGELDPDLLTRMTNLENRAKVMVTRFGASDNFLDFTAERLKTDHDNLLARDQALEFREADELIMEFTMQNYLYNAALQMGSRLLQPSLFNFIN
ncbi:hypothetical protein FACS1894191_6970 [Clostridia bacterium]|nr:hypothetical protein FACS1894191_6970 [Clostridia bacterium]